MDPFIRDRDCVTLKPIKGIHPETGDIVAFYNSETSSVVIHRIIGIKNGRYLIKGDNCNTPDGWVPHRHLIGIVVSVERMGKNIRLGLGSEKKIISSFSRFPCLMRLIRLLYS